VGSTAASKDLVKKLQDNAANVTKFQSTITAHDRSITKKEVEIAKQKAVVETFNAKIGAKEVSQKAKLLQLGSERDVAVSILNSQLELKARDAKANRAKTLSVGRELSTTSNRLKKFLSDITKLWMDYDELGTQHRNSKSEASCLKKELTTMRNRVGKQLQLMLAHKDQMKDKGIERECIRFDKAKDNNYTKLLAKEQKHINIQE
jgi:hypothetical protein